MSRSYAKFVGNPDETIPSLALDPSPPDQDLIATLRRLQLISSDESVEVTPLTGGVSSDIVRVQAQGRDFCVKRALSKLKVQADWRAPVERNHWEVEWMRTSAAIDPTCAPAVLAEDRDAGVFVMEFLDSANHPLWKRQLSEGTIDIVVARQVGERIARIHRATARDAALRQRFATDHIFGPIRIEPYLLATAQRHPDCAAALSALAHATANTKLALVHGDVSPKNILIGPKGPIFLDAECAWFGDPAFDLAFCVNHLLLKCLWRPRWTRQYLNCFQALTAAYLAQVNWENPSTLETRTARLLPGLFLARVDGKSPAEYITEPWQQTKVREIARALLLAPTHSLASIQARWQDAMADRMDST